VIYFLQKKLFTLLTLFFEFNIIYLGCCNQKNVKGHDSMKNLLRKIVSVGLIAASVGCMGIMPVSAASSVISPEVANDNYNVAFKEPYSSSKVYKNQKADNIFKSVSLSAFDSFSLVVNKSSNFSTTDTFNVYQSNAENGTFTKIKSVACKASKTQKVTIKQSHGKTLYYSVEIKNKNGTVLYAQRYKVTTCKDEIANNKYKFEFRQTTTAGDDSSYKSTAINFTSTDDAETKVQMLDEKNVYLDITNVPDNYYLVVERKSRGFVNYPTSTNVSGEIKANNNKISYGVQVYSDNAASIKYTLKDAAGNTIACQKYLFVGKEKTASIKTTLIGNYDGASNGYNYLSTNSADVAGDTSTKTYTRTSNFQIHSRILPIVVEKYGGAYDDSEKVRVYVKESAASSYGTPQKVLSHATTEDNYRTYATLAKTGVNYDIKVETTLKNNKVINHIFQNINASAESSVGIHESHSEMDTNGKLSTNYTNVFVSQDDTVKVTNICELPLYSGANKYDSYHIRVAGLGKTNGTVKIFTKQDNKETAVFTIANLNTSDNLSLKDLGITPKIGQKTEIIVRSYNVNGTKLSQWSRTITFVDPKLFNFSFSLRSSSGTCYSYENTLDTSLVTPLEKHIISDESVIFNYSYFSLKCNYGGYSGLPSNVTGNIYIRKSSETKLTKLCSVGSYILNGYNDMRLNRFCSLCNYPLADGESYVMYIKFTNNTTGKVFHQSKIPFNYVTNIVL